MFNLLTKINSPMAFVAMNRPDEGGAGYGGDGGDGDHYDAQGGENSDPPQEDPRDLQIRELSSRLKRFEQRQQQTEQASQSQRQQQQLAQRARTIQGNVNAAQREQDEAKRDLQNAHDEGDPAKIAEATARVSSAAAALTRHNYEAEVFTREVREMEQRSGGHKPTSATQQQQPQENVRTDNLQKWRQKNSGWYGVDPEMTKAAHEAHSQIEGEGILEVGSENYFKAIDERVKRRFPDRFQSAPTDHSTGRAGTSNRRDDREAARLPGYAVEAYRRMGINMDDPEVAKRMAKNRGLAVQKGFLGEKPAPADASTTRMTR